MKYRKKLVVIGGSSEKGIMVDEGFVAGDMIEHCLFGKGIVNVGNLTRGGIDKERKWIEVFLESQQVKGQIIRGSFAHVDSIKLIEKGKYHREMEGGDKRKDKMKRYLSLLLLSVFLVGWK